MTSSAGSRSRFPIYFVSVWSAALGLLYLGGTVRSAYLSLDLFANSENAWQDKLFSVFGRQGWLKSPDPRILIASIDDDSIAELGWPFPRREQARLLDTLKSLGVRTVAFDVHFPNKDWRDPAGDRAFAEATRRFGGVVHLVLFRLESSEGGIIPSLVWPYPGLAEAAGELGHPTVTTVLDPDGHLRRIALLWMFPTGQTELPGATWSARNPLPHMGVAAASMFAGRPVEEFEKRYPPPWIQSINFRQPRSRPRHPYEEEESEKKHGQKLINPEKVLSAYPYVSVVDILKGRLTQGQKRSLKGSLVLVGSTSLGAYDHFPSPFPSRRGEGMPGVQYNANIVDNLLHDDFLLPAGWGWILLAVFVMAWLPLVFQRTSPVVGSALAVAVLASWLAFTAWRFFHGVRWDFLGPSFAFFSSFFALTVHRVLTEEHKKRFIKETFSQYLSPQVVDILISDPNRLKLGGDRREMTAFFLDVAHFTSISENMDPQVLQQFVNSYLSNLTDVILRNGGVLDKFIGDGVMAFWNAPMDQPNHAELASLAAVECVQAIEEFNRKAVRNGGMQVPSIRIGVNTGAMVVGNMGSKDRFSYTILGDEVNLASRLEGANTFFGTRIMVSEATYRASERGVEGRLLGRVKVIGKEHPVWVYELFGRKGDLSDDWSQALPIYQRGMKLYFEKDFAGAVSAFQEVLKIMPQDYPTLLYLRSAESCAAVPPPPDWDGVFDITSK